MRAASFDGGIVVFGGSFSTVTYKFSEEGQLEEDLSYDPLIP